MKEFIYKTLDFILGGAGIKRTFSGNTVRMPTRYFRYFNDSFEKENLRIINENVKADMYVIDVGAHIGLMSAIFGKRVGNKGKVFAFEPTPSTFNILEKTILINKLPQIVTPVKAALSNHSGEATFYISGNLADNSNSLANNKRTDRKERRINVKLYSLDNFLKENFVPAIDFIKIDAEGAELQVLKGATHTIEKYHPQIILALHPQAIRNFGDSLQQIWELVNEMDYKISYCSKEMTAREFISRKDLFDVFLIPN